MGNVASTALPLASAAGSLIGGANRAQQQKAELSFQQKNAQVALLLDRVQIEERKRQVQEDLRKAVAATTVKANARGIKISGTSQENALDAVFSDAGKNLGLLNFQDRTRVLKGQANDAEVRRRKGLIDDEFQSFATGQAFTLGSRLFSTPKKK
jgi:hypothetical protein